MRFTIAIADLESLLKGAGISRPKKTDVFTLSACAARVFVETKDGVAGIEALVLSDGAVSLPSQKFSAVLKTYKGHAFLISRATPMASRSRRSACRFFDTIPTRHRPETFASFQRTCRHPLRSVLRRGANFNMRDDA